MQSLSGDCPIALSQETLLNNHTHRSCKYWKGVFKVSVNNKQKMCMGGGVSLRELAPSVIITLFTENPPDTINHCWTSRAHSCYSSKLTQQFVLIHSGDTRCWFAGWSLEPRQTKQRNSLYLQAIMYCTGQVQIPTGQRSYRIYRQVQKYALLNYLSIEFWKTEMTF